MMIEYRAFSECGPRYKNEDAIGRVVMPEGNRAMFILCDGMGGHRNGDMASQTVVKSICDYWRENPGVEDYEKKINDAANEAKTALEQQPPVEMGTTMVMVCIEDRIARIAHCGDSRCYQYATWGKQHWHTTDHRAKTPEGWEYLSKCFMQGSEKHIPEIDEYFIGNNDKFLLCSDGLYRCFKDGEIEHLLETVNDIDELRDLLLKRGIEEASDNFSAIIIKVRYV